MDGGTGPHHHIEFITPLVNSPRDASRRRSSCTQPPRLPHLESHSRAVLDTDSRMRPPTGPQCVTELVPTDRPDERFGRLTLMRRGSASLRVWPRRTGSNDSVSAGMYSAAEAVVPDGHALIGIVWGERY